MMLFVSIKRSIGALAGPILEDGSIPLQMLLSVIFCKQPPIVFMHGISATIKDGENFTKYIPEAVPGAKVFACEVGNGKVDSIVMPIDQQIEELRICI